jgi:hypothetical protein
MTKRARLRFEMKKGNFMMSRLIDIETGISIPIKSIKIDMGIHNWRDEACATVVIPLSEIELDDMLVEFVTEKEE